MALHVAVVPRPTGDFEILPTSYFEVHGPAGLSGSALAKALAQLGHHDLWPAGDVQLSELEELPDRGMLTLTPFKRSATPGPSTAAVVLLAAKGPDCGQHFSLTRGCYSIGRNDCDLHVLDPAMSRHHADIIVDHTSIELVRATGVPADPDQQGKGEPQFLSLGDEFVLGDTTFRLCPARPRTPDAVTQAQPPWPPPVTTLRPTSATSRPWLTLTTALLPLAIGVVLALTLGSWIFMAFSALGLVTGGIPATHEISSRRKMRRRIRRLSADLISDLERRIPPIGIQVLYRNPSVSGTRCSNKQHATSTTHPLRFGSGCVMPPLEIDPPTYRGPQVHPARGPVITDVSPGGLGVLAGAGSMLGPVIRAVTLQLASSCSRTDSSLIIVGSTDLLPAEVRYLPGVRACDGLADRHIQFESLPRGSVVIAMPGFTDMDRLESLARSTAGDRRGPSLILTGINRHDRADWTLDTATSTFRDGDRVIHVHLDGLSRSTMASAAIAADPEVVTGSGPRGGLGRSGSTDGAQLDTRSGSPWSGSSASALRCRIGHSADGACDLDFVGDGPHALVIGTTGAGKSELLKSMITDLQHRYGPDQLALVLLDFKGGSTLGPYAETPHCQSLVTDLNAESGERVLAGLRIELQRRESIFRESNVEDYTGYRRLALSEAPPLPRLLVIVDEFRILSDELPDAVQELMRIATVGRSLGMHLLLSTQRPQGVVTASMRANINSVISLRLLSPSDSQELLGSSVAAEIPVSAPGTGFFRRAGEELRPFRSVPVEQPKPSWKILELGPEFQDCHTVATIHGQSAEATSPAMKLAALTSNLACPTMPVSSFAQPLPDELQVLPDHLRREPSDGAIALGMVDDLENQRLSALWWSPEKQRRLGIIAAPGSAASSTLLYMLRELATDEPERHVYLLDGTGAFSPVAALPRVAGYVGTGEPERIQELLDVFTLDGNSPGGPAATRVLVVSGLAAWSAVMGASDFAVLDDRLAALARSAEQRNACLIVLGDRDLMSSRYLALAEHRLYIRFGLGAETTMGWPKLRSTAPLPGRAVWTSPDVDGKGAIVQLCAQLPSGPEIPGPTAKLPVQRCSPLPTTVAVSALGTTHARPGRYPVAVIGPDNRPWIWEPGPVGLILGGPGTGKTSVIKLLADRLKQHVTIAFTVEQDCAPPDVLLLDDVLELPDAELTRIEAMIRAGTRVVMSADPDRSRLMRLPAAARMLSSNAFLLLNPRQAADGDVPGWRIRPHLTEIPGRAVAMVHGTLVQVQCAQAHD